MISLHALCRAATARRAPARGASVSWITNRYEAFAKSQEDLSISVRTTQRLPQGRLSLPASGSGPCCRPQAQQSDDDWRARPWSVRILQGRQELLPGPLRLGGPVNPRTSEPYSKLQQRNTASGRPSSRTGAHQRAGST